MEKNKMNVLPIIYLVFGMYFINFKMLYIKIPEAMAFINNWIIFAGGVLFIIAFLRSIVYSKKRIIRRALKQ